MRAEEETRMAAALGIRKEFPLLNEQLIATVLAQDSLSHAAQAGQGRLIARRAFAPYLPPLLCTDPSKWRDQTEAETKEMHMAWRQDIASMLTRLQTNHHPQLLRWWNLSEVWRLTEQALEADEPWLDDPLKRGETLTSPSEGLETLLDVSLWLQWLEGERPAEPPMSKSRPGVART
jgi:hypothetical protein